MLSQQTQPRLALQKFINIKALTFMAAHILAPMFFFSLLFTVASIFFRLWKKKMQASQINETFSIPTG